MNIEIAVKDQRLTVKSPRNLVAGTAGLTGFTISFDESWENLKKILLFEAVTGDGRRQRVELLLKGSEGQVPWEVLERPGTLRISAVGLSEDGIRQPTALMAEPLYIIPSGTLSGSPAEKRTPELWEQAVTATTKAANAAVSAEAASAAAILKAEAALAAAESAAAQAGNAAQAAETAANGAASAAAGANQAASGAEQVNISAEQTPTGASITVTDREGVETSVQIDTLMSVNTWAYVKNAVRLGLGPTLFPVGYEFTTHDSDTGQDIIWVVRAHNHHTPANDGLMSSMTLETKYVYSMESGSRFPMAICSGQALYYAEEALSPSTYNFTIVNQDWYPADNGKTFQFTLTKPVPAGGQIILTYAGGNANAAAAGKTVTTRESGMSAETLESAVVSLGSAGTCLGQTDGAGNVNHFHRVVGGSNNYAQSAVRQWLNSGAEAGSWYRPQEKFSLALPAALRPYHGFLHGLPDDFLAAVEPAVVPCRTNDVFECQSADGSGFDTQSTYTVNDRFFLLSRPEIYGAAEDDNIRDGEILEYYEGLTDAERKRFDNAGAASSLWLRSCYPNFANTQRYVDGTGAVTYNSAFNRTGVSVACIIA